jgi:hypothetical protein
VPPRERLGARAPRRRAERAAKRLRREERALEGAPPSDAAVVQRHVTRSRLDWLEAFGFVHPVRRVAMRSAQDERLSTACAKVRERRAQQRAHRTVAPPRGRRPHVTKDSPAATARLAQRDLRKRRGALRRVVQNIEARQTVMQESIDLRRPRVPPRPEQLAQPQRPQLIRAIRPFADASNFHNRAVVECRRPKTAMTSHGRRVHVLTRVHC